MDTLPKLLSEMRERYPDSIPSPVYEAYCQRYLHYYHRHIKYQPIQFISGWRWSEARRREFRSAFEITDLLKFSDSESR
jgi:hypothetical protein